MGQPARNSAKDEPEPELAALKRRFAALAERAEAELALSPGDRRLTSLLIIAREAVTQLSRAAFGEARITSSARQARIDGYEEGFAAASRQRAPRARHASTGRRPLLNVVRNAGAPAAVFLVAAKARTAHLVQAGHGVKLGSIKVGYAHVVTATLATGAIAGAVAVGAPSSLLPSHPAGHGRFAAPAASVEAAAPVTSRSPAAFERAVTTGRPKSGSEAEGSRRLAPSQMPPPWYPQTGAAAGPGQSSPSAPSSSSAAPSGTLSADVTTADLTSGAPVTVTLSASGGPVDWHAWCGGTDVVLSASQGTAAPGQPSELVLSPAQVLDGLTGASCHIWPGSIQVSVILPLPPVLAPDPGASASDVPSQAPVPSPGPS